MPIREFEPLTDIPESELLEYIGDLTSEPNVVVVRQFKQPKLSSSGETLWTVIAGRIIPEAEATANTDTGGQPTDGGTASPPSLSATETVPQNFSMLIDQYVSAEIDAPRLKVVTLAQWILESGRGSSDLAVQHFNYAGLKFRHRMTAEGGFNPPASSVDYNAHDGHDTYCKFVSAEHFINGYWHFVDSGPYTDWKAFKTDPTGYVGYLKLKGYAADPNYVAKVEQLMPEAANLLTEAANRLSLDASDFVAPASSVPTSTSSVVPKSWMPNCSMARIICHWTAGKHKASNNDRYHYHILIEEDGRLVRGTHTIKDNVSTSDDKYAAHTKGTNTGSIGVSVCCMSGAKSSPFNAGNYPMTKRQWDVMIDVVRDLCRRYNITPQPHTVLGHGEVQKNIGTQQSGKWDPMKLPWEPNLTYAEVGQLLRHSVLAKL